MAAGDWFDSRHARRDDPDDGERPDDGSAGGTPDDGLRDIPGSRPTQALPTVTRSEGLTLDDPASIRAVAKRVPSALPALGRDEITDVPPSARAAADRRRLAREPADGQTPAAEPADPPPPMVPRPRPQPEVERVQRVPGASLVAQPPDRDVELRPLGGRAREALPPAPTREPPGAPGQERPHGRHTGTPPSAPPGPPPPLPRVQRDERPPRPYLVAPEQTDEWAEVPAATDPPPPRHGSPPSQVPADSWETAPLPRVGDTYQGRRRRLRTGSRLSRAGWVVVCCVVLALSAAVTVPFLLTGRDATSGTAQPTGSTPSATAVTATSGLPVIGIPGTTETPTPSPTSSPPSPPFQPLTVQAEDHGRDFDSRSYCNNVKGVLLGSHGSGQSVNFGSFTAPNQATYQVTVYAGTESSAAPVQLSVDGANQPNWSVTGCGQTTSVSLQLGRGTHGIVVTFKGNGNQNVLIDKIVIARH